MAAKKNKRPSLFGKNGAGLAGSAQRKKYLKTKEGKAKLERDRKAQTKKAKAKRPSIKKAGIAGSAKRKSSAKTAKRPSITKAGAAGSKERKVFLASPEGKEYLKRRKELMKKQANARKGK